MGVPHIPNLPHALYWLIQPKNWALSAETELTIIAPAKTDWFSDPQGAVNLSNAPVLLFPAPGPCILRAQADGISGSVSDGRRLHRDLSGYSL